MLYEIISCYFQIYNCFILKFVNPLCTQNKPHYFIKFKFRTTKQPYRDRQFNYYGDYTFATRTRCFSHETEIRLLLLLNVILISFVVYYINITNNHDAPLKSLTWAICIIDVGCNQWTGTAYPSGAPEFTPSFR